MKTINISPDSMLPRHWAFASVVALENITVILQEASLMLSTAYMLDQLVAEFQADPLIQADPQQRALWAQLREHIAPYLKEGLRFGQAESEIGGVR